MVHTRIVNRTKEIMEVKVFSARGVPQLAHKVSEGKHQDIYFSVHDSYRDYRLMFDDTKKTEFLLTSEDMLTYGEVIVDYKQATADGVVYKYAIQNKYMTPGLFTRFKDFLHCLVL